MLLSDKANEITLVKKAKSDPKNTSESKNVSIKNTPARKLAGERFVLEIFNVFLIIELYGVRFSLIPYTFADIESALRCPVFSALLTVAQGINFFSTPRFHCTLE